MGELGYRHLQESDFDALHQIMQDWNVVRQLGSWPWPADPAFTRARSRPYKGEGFVWAICIDDRLIGFVGVTKGDLGYALSPAIHKQQIMTRATQRAIAHAFATTDRMQLTGSTWWDNHASYRL